MRAAKGRRLARSADGVLQLKQLIELTEANPEIRLMVGFTRRFDASYAAALDQVRSGAIGRPVTLRFQSCEKYDDSPFMHRYVPQRAPWFLLPLVRSGPSLPPSTVRTMLTPHPRGSYLSRCGGIFLDSVVHDIDLSLMYLGDLALPSRCIAFGSASLHRHLRSPSDHASHRGDADNAVGMVQFHSGAIAWYYNSRTAAAGYDNASEIFGERGKLSVNLVARRDRLEIADGKGLSCQSVESWYERYREAFVVETRHFVEAVLQGREVAVPIRSVLTGLRIALALQESLGRGGAVVRFDERGERIVDEESAAKL